ncbi:hypothetical protein MA6G0728R_1344 [Mycobacteroides abscessus 6G-0728-R]|uniref:Uncharacterized protein n=1 Tax=Mycobacteroides abscessus 1948 TaxID=1299323 RepID=A0A829QQS9_9MYCO|nr:hypothetical protein MA6G1108_1340 [Mycobacteroides abscessus 6G-1108]EIU99569.1 hypothetical protein MA6G0728R_1344 [Mycobacteroides abscessus 6G-0728-R]EIV57453.1 hypothetical protein MA3A0930R_1376 [Mycobacteroides abscessus 3A-0930-R]EIV83064.1 hypothetical protein MM3A0810R_1369 [Mycobacteroides abscessus 3A-0810-R]EUA65275.1 hypothetical protein I542_5455 [Mycobacteroides abscessus 1948]EUA82711.1 hypothetical protein I544_4034 [Mycobacteroides abscessus subsp. bolletii 103]
MAEHSTAPGGSGLVTPDRDSGRAARSGAQTGNKLTVCVRI